LGIGGELVQAEALKANKPEVIVENARRIPRDCKSKHELQMASSSIAAREPRVTFDPSMLPWFS